MIAPTPQMVLLFHSRMQTHLELVRRNLLSMTGFLSLSREELESRARDHDKSKFSDPERIGYIWLTWNYHCQKSNKRFALSPEISRTIEAAREKHRSHNRHHLEAHRHPSQMTTLDIVEMVCDWHAISQENHREPGATREWATKNACNNASLSKRILRLIFESIDELERRTLN